MRREETREEQILPYYLHHPELRVKTLEDYFNHHAQEDRERDTNMITSEDLLDLHLSELKDYKESGQPGFYSRRTVKLLGKVESGILWALRVASEQMDHYGGGFAFAHWSEKLKKAQDERKK